MGILARQLVEWMLAIEVAPAAAREAARRSVLDQLAAVVAGVSTDGATAARRGAPLAWGRGEVPIWLTGERASPAAAVFANAAAGSMLDIDDGHRAAAGHPGAAIVPAVLAVAESIGADAARALTAIAIGYEIGVRIAACRDLRTIDTVCTGRWAGQAVAAATGWLRGLAPETIAHAMAISGMVAPYLTHADFTQIGNHVKEAIPSSAANGITAIELALAGYQGPTDFLDDHRYFDGEKLVSGLGGERWMIEGSYFKPYSCCRWIHAALDAVLELRAQGRISAENVRAIRVETFEWALKLNNQPAPKSLQAAQFSIPFCLAVALVHGRDVLVPMVDPTLLADPKTLAVAARVELALDPELDLAFPAGVPARVIVTLADETITRTVLAPWGEPTNPMGWDDLLRKLDGLAAGRITPEAASALRAGIEALTAGELRPLLHALQAPSLIAGTAEAHAPLNPGKVG